MLSPPIKRSIIFISILWAILAPPSFMEAQTPSGITRYYVRLDHHFSSHRSVRTIVTMVPAENDYRSLPFSRILVDGMVKASPQSADTRVADLARKAIFSQILESHGLKSIQTLNQDTIVSYEGMIISPADIAISVYDPKKGGYLYTAGVEFSPLAFPDQWTSLQRRYHTKQILNDFFLLFK